MQSLRFSDFLFFKEYFFNFFFSVDFLLSCEYQFLEKYTKILITQQPRIIAKQKYIMQDIAETPSTQSSSYQRWYVISHMAEKSNNNKELEYVRSHALEKYQQLTSCDVQSSNKQIYYRKNAPKRCLWTESFSISSVKFA